MNILISLKASNAKFVAAEATAEGKLVANAAADYPFIMQDLGNGKLRLVAMPNQMRYVEARGGGGQGLFTTSRTPGTNDVFTLVQVSAKEFAFLAPNGTNYMTCEDNGDVTARGTVRGAKETFVLTRFQPDQKKGSKKAQQAVAEVDGDVMWNDKTHEIIVDTTLRLLYKSHIERPMVRALYALTVQPAFKNAMLEGLRDADYQSEYTGLLWKFHFYHPGTGSNYAGFGENAKSMGTRYFEIAVGLGNEIFRRSRRGINPTPAELRACGYALGIASHFITDLTQPMHSSNFANVFGDLFPLMNALEWRHKGLEEMTEDIVVKQNYLGDAPDLRYDQFNPEPYGSSDAILHEAAVIANATFVRTVRPLMPSVVGSWKEADVKKILDESIKTIGLHSVARFLTFWAMQASKVDLVRPGYLYRIKGHGGRYVTRDGDWIKMAPANNSAHQEFFFIGNDDGTHRIVSNTLRGRRWTMNDEAFDLTVVKLLLPSQSDLKRASFRLVSNGRRIKIHEFTRNEVLAVRTSWSWVDHLLRWADENADTHWFELEEVGPVSLSESETTEVVTTMPEVAIERQGKQVNISLTINM